jgi:hypothetical protein
MPILSDTALRTLLALLRHSFRFDPAASRWVHPGDWFERSDIERASGLSDQGTRNGLQELEEEGWAEVDRTGRSHRYRLRAEVPDCRYTQVPTALLDTASTLDSGTGLRIVLAVLRRTWGWTSTVTDPETGRTQVEHDRWAQISTAALAAATGRSKTAIAAAVESLQGRWIERVRPGTGAYQYRFLPGSIVMESSGDRHRVSSSFSEAIANDLTPDRQRSDPPTSSIEKRDRNKQQGDSRSKSNRRAAHGGTSSRASDAMPDSENDSERTTTDVDASGLSPRKQALGRKLVNVGVWPHRARECLRRYSAARIEANFELYRERADEISDGGAWLCAAITDGYAPVGRYHDARGADRTGAQGSSRGERAPADSSSSYSDASSSGAPQLEKPSHKAKVSAEEKSALIRHCRSVTEEDFHRYRCSPEPGEKQFLYFDPAIGGPTCRTVNRSHGDR